MFFGGNLYFLKYFGECVDKWATELIFVYIMRRLLVNVALSLKRLGIAMLAISASPVTAGQ